MSGKTSGMLQKNEEQANYVVARVMRVTFLIFLVIFILNLLGVFIIDSTTMIAAFLVGSVCLWLPTVLCKVMDTQAWYMKYVMVVCASIFIMVLTVTLTYHAVVVYVYPIAIASLYFSKKLNIFATGLTGVFVSVGQVLGFLLPTTTDHNFYNFQRLVVFSIIPRFLSLICIAAIFTMLCSRTAQMLGNLMGAEEQKEMLDHLTKFRETNQGLSMKMKNAVEVLANHTQTSNALNQQITSETAEIVRGTKDNSRQIGRINEGMESITAQMTEFAKMSKELAKEAEEIRILSRENQTTMDESTESMRKITESAQQCLESIARLENKSKEIEGIIRTITEISSQTELLALNASIEAARAGEQGRGFTVVAQEIQKLSEQSQSSVSEIEEIIHQVIHDTHQAMEVMNVSAKYTEQGLHNIGRAGASTSVITESNNKMSREITKLDEISQQILKHERMVTDAMQSVHENTDQNLTSIEQVMQATEQSSQGTEQLVTLVEDIQKISELLVAE